MGNIRHITLPAGFVAGAVHCGLKTSTREDIAILAAAKAVPAAIVTTTNQVIGAPVRWCRQVLPRGYGKVRGVVVNAGNSNVCNGRRGDRDAARMARLAGEAVGCKAEQMLVCSTGVIGHPLPMDKVRAGIAAVGERLSTDLDEAVATAILTTDLAPKTAVVQGRIAGCDLTVAGICKGSGMIAPSLATMLAFITTDAKLAPAALGKALKAAAATTFNAISVDGDTSTSDTVVALASGAGGGHTLHGKDLVKFQEMLTEVCAHLAEAIVRDGEGATKLLRITVKGARSEKDASRAAKTIARSPLVKCAAHGGDPNWGRILAAAGRSRATVDQDLATCRIGGIPVMRRGTSCAFDLEAVQAHMAGKDIEIELDLALGDARYTALTCDFSREYVAINADYHT